MSRYDWDEVKEAINLRRHGVTFDEAEQAIMHPLAVDKPDIGHSLVESRFKVVGWSEQHRLLVVIVSASGLRPRIISARRATKRERHAYETRS